MGTRDHRDLCIEQLRADLSDKENLFTEAIIDAQSYREIAQQAVHLLKDRNSEVDRKCQTIERLRAETRCLREQILKETETSE